MDEQSHIVSGIYTSRAEAEAVSSDRERADTSTDHHRRLPVTRKVDSSGTHAPR